MKNIKARIIKLASGMTFVLAVMTLLSVATPEVYAEGLDFTLGVDSVLTLTLPDDVVVLPVNPSSTGTFGSADIEAYVESNNPTGYVLNLTVDKTYLESDTYNPTTSEFPRIETLASTVGESNFTLNKWGFKKSSDTDYNPILTENELSSVSGPNSEDASITVATKLDFNTAPGSYATTLNFALVPNVVPPLYLQDLTQSQLASLMPSVGDSITAYDKRDEQAYTVAHLGDGNYWMSNLNLGATTLTTDLTSENTNLATTVSADTFNGWKVASGSGSYTAAEYIPVPGTDAVSQTSYGALYNYCATSAGTICADSNDTDALYDICPTGWRLPSGGINGELNALFNSDHYNRDFSKMVAPLADDGAAFSLAGYFYDSTPSSQGNTGYYWSSTLGNTTKMYFASFYPTSAFLISSDSRSMGYSIRCLAKQNMYTITFNAGDGGTGTMASQAIEGGQTAAINANTFTREGYDFDGWLGSDGNTYTDGQSITAPISGGTLTLTAQWKKQVLYMQNVDTWGSTVTEGTSVQAVDIRDDKTYWVTRLSDGKLWMTQNLDLDLSTSTPLTSENTNLKTSGSGAYSSGYTNSNGVITWTPIRNTIATSAIDSSGNISGWSDSNTAPYSVDPGDWYWDNDPFYASETCNYLTGCTSKFQKTTPYDSNGEHGHVGNYYNWSAAIASNSSSSLSSSTLSNIANNPQNSICPKGWRLPTIYSSSTTNDTRNEVYYLMNKYSAYVTSGSERDKKLTASPLYFVRGGRVYSSSLHYSGSGGSYWSSTVYSSSSAYHPYFNSSRVTPADNDTRLTGFSVRCVAE